MSSSSRSKGSPRKFAEKIALLNKKEAESTAEFEKIIQEVERTTRAPPLSNTAGVLYHHQNHFGWGNEDFLPPVLPTRSSSFSNWQTHPNNQQQNYSNQIGTHQQQQHPFMINNTRHNHHQPQNNRSNSHHQHHHQDQPYPQATNFPQRVPQGLQHHQQSPPAMMGSTSARGHSISPSSIDNDAGICFQQQQAQFRVPNIEIFPIDDEQTCPPVVGTQQSNNNNNDFINGNYYRNDCSNSPSISSSRSMPNIASLSVSGCTAYSSATPTSSNAQSRGPEHIRASPQNQLQGNYISSSFSTMARANSTNIIADNPNTAPFSDHLSRSTDAYYSYLDDYDDSQSSIHLTKGREW